jgi:Tfp pilus assembly protein PilO
MKLDLKLPDKMFGQDSRLLVVWVEPLVVGLIILVTTLGLIVPKLSLVTEKSDQIKSVVAKNKEAKEKIAYLQAMDSEVIKGETDRLGQGLLPQRSAYLLLGVVRQVTEEFGYVIDDFIISMMGDVKELEGEAKDKKSRFDKLPIRVSLVGPKEKYVDLLKGLERTLPIISLNTVEMKAAPEAQIATIDLNMSAYYLPEMDRPNIEKLDLADLTPSKQELDLMSQLEEYRTLNVESFEVDKSFTEYQREDPFFIP